MEYPLPRDMSVAVSLGSINVYWNVEGMAWSPDVARDMQNRAMEMVSEALQLAYEYGLTDVMDGEPIEFADSDEEVFIDDEED